MPLRRGGPSANGGFRGVQLKHAMLGLCVLWVIFAGVRFTSGPGNRPRGAAVEVPVQVERLPPKSPRVQLSGTSPQHNEGHHSSGDGGQHPLPPHHGDPHEDRHHGTPSGGDTPEPTHSERRVGDDVPSHEDDLQKAESRPRAVNTPVRELDSNYRRFYALPEHGATHATVVIPLRVGDSPRTLVRTVADGSSVKLEFVFVHEEGAVADETKATLKSAASSRSSVKFVVAKPSANDVWSTVPLWRLLNKGAEAADKDSATLIFLSPWLEARTPTLVEDLIKGLASQPDASMVGCTTLRDRKRELQLMQELSLAPAPGGDADSATGDEDEAADIKSTSSGGAPSATTPSDTELQIGAQGIDISYSTGNSVAFVRRLAGFPEGDPRAQGCQPVTVPSIACAAVPRKVFYDAAGLAEVDSYDDFALAGLVQRQVKEKFAKTLSALVRGAEMLMSSINIGDARMNDMSSRELVRTCFSSIMAASDSFEQLGIPNDPDATLDEAERKKIHEEAKDLMAHLRAHCEAIDKTTKAIGRISTRSFKPPEIPLVDVALFAESKRLRAYVCSSPAIERVDLMPALLREARLMASSASHVISDTEGSNGGKSDGSPASSSSSRQQVSAVGDELRLSNLRRRIPGNSVAESSPLRVVWDAFCCGCCGFSNEIVHFVYPLHWRVRVHVIPQLSCFCSGFPSSVSDSLVRMQLSYDHYVAERYSDDEVVVWVSHTDPTGYRSSVFSKRKPDYVVGRSMYEFTRIDENWVTNANKDCDEIWVPAEWVRRVFINSGVREHKLVVIGEAVDVNYFSPDAGGHVTLPLQGAQQRWRHWCNKPGKPSAYKFYSNFKWEDRKGWEILFEAYATGFEASDDVSMYIQTHIWFSGGPETYGDAKNTTYLREQVLAFFASREDLGVTDLDQLPHFCFITESLDESSVVSMYNSVNAFVLPTRGEGWGLPAMQAMSMALPTITTAWGGQLEFLSPDVSLMIPVDAVEELEEDSVYRYRRGKRWARPSTNATRRLMRLVFDKPDKARAVGKRARQHIVDNFSEEAIRDKTAARLQQIRKIVLKRRLDAAARAQEAAIAEKARKRDGGKRRSVKHPSSGGDDAHASA